MKVRVTKEIVVITEYGYINEGEHGVNICCFDLPPCFDGLNVTASFNNIPVPVVDGKCCIPTLNKGTATLGVYAYRENDGVLELMYSPQPTVFFVNSGSYNGVTNVERVPSVSEFERFCNNFVAEIQKSLKDVSAKRHYYTFSVLGDSYSTFIDFTTPDGNLCWYPAGNPNATGSNNDVSSVEQMWWHIFANQYESALQVNNSYSGSPICYDGWGAGTTDSKETGFIARAKNIGTPELIFIFGGSNDSWVRVPLGEYKYEDWVEDDFTSFRPALAYLLNYLKQHNVGARIIFILSGNIINSGNQSTATNIDESVLTICNHYGVEVIELDEVSVSNGHPTVAGQQSIAQQVYDYITGSKLTGITATISKSDFASGVSLEDLKSYLTVTAAYDDGTNEIVTDYMLSGGVVEGTNTITISYGAYSVTVDIVVSEVELTNISAQLSQTEFNMGVTLDSVKPYLTVTATYGDGSTSIVNDYTLSGELNVGENIITISYGGKTTTVNVTVAIESGTYQLSVEALDNASYQYYCPVFNTKVNESIRIVFTCDFARFNNTGTIKTFDSLPTNYKNGVSAYSGVDYSVEYVDQTVSLTSDKPYFALSIPTAAVNPLTIKNFHCYVDGVEVEPVTWISMNGGTVTAVKLS